MIILKDLQKVYCGGKVPFEALKCINLHVNAKDFVTIIGRSGSGKSTLLNIIGLLDTFDKGQYFFEGRNMRELSMQQLGQIRAKEIGFVFQSFNLLKHLSAIENVELPLGYAGKPRKERKEIAAEMLELVGLGDKRYNRPGELSGGQQQRVAIARALVHSPRLILADEPTGNLDLATAKQIMKLLIDLNVKKGLTVLLVTHDVEMVSRANRILKISDGLLFEDQQLASF